MIHVQLLSLLLYYLLWGSATVTNLANSVNTLTFIRLRHVQHEQEEVLQELGVVVRKMQTFAVFPEETQDRNTENFPSTKRLRNIKRDGSHLGARNRCPEDSKELGSSDCISVKEAFFSFSSLCHVLWKTIPKALPLCTHTAAESSCRSGLPGWSIHCTEVEPGRDCGWRRPDRETQRDMQAEQNCLIRQQLVDY